MCFLIFFSVAPFPDYGKEPLQITGSSSETLMNKGPADGFRPLPCNRTTPLPQFCCPVTPAGVTGPADRQPA